jgi:hypothetical protein
VYQRTSRSPLPIAMVVGAIMLTLLSGRVRAQEVSFNVASNAPRLSSAPSAHNAAFERTCTSLCNATCDIPTQIIVTNGSPHNSTKPTTFSCDTGACNGCGSAARAGLPSVLAAVSEGRTNDLAAMIAADTNMTINTSRGTLQIVGCANTAIVASIPLSPQLITAIDRQLGERRIEVAARADAMAARFSLASR